MLLSGDKDTQIFRKRAFPDEKSLEIFPLFLCSLQEKCVSLRQYLCEVAVQVDGGCAKININVELQSTL